MSARKMGEIQQRQQQEVLQQEAIRQEQERQEAIRRLVAEEGGTVSSPEEILRQGPTSMASTGNAVTAPESPSGTAQMRPSEHYQDEVKEVVSLSDIWNKLETSSDAWLLILDASPKEITVSRYIDRYKQQGILIRKSAKYYVSWIDEVLSEHPSFVDYPFRDVLKYAAILDYDFENGQNKDQMVRKLLSPIAYEKNKHRLSP